MFAREGYPFILGAIGLTLILCGFSINYDSTLLRVLAVVTGLIAVWVGWFFRNPDRKGERGDSLVISPADGLVVLITDINEPSYVKGACRRVSVFMNVFDVHVNRYPVSGTVEFVERKAGKFLNAMAEASSVENEQASVGINTGNYRILMRQIAGLIARRIITDSVVNDKARQGERMGLIRFGSRVDIFLPPDATLRVTTGERVKAGISVLATLPSARDHSG